MFDVKIGTPDKSEEVTESAVVTPGTSVVTEHDMAAEEFATAASWSGN